MPLELTQLMPHRAPMCWLDALTECTPVSAGATATFGPDHFATAGGAVLETALVECLAQTVAAALGQRARDGAGTGAPRPGMLVAVSGFKIHSRPPAGSRLDIEIREQARLGPMLMIAGTIRLAGQPVAEGNLTLYA